MRNSPPKRNLRVCVFSAHPFLLKQFHELLSASRIPLQVRNIELAPQVASLQIPRASVYLIDAYGRTRMVEALIGKVLDRFPGARFLVLSEVFSEADAFPLLRLGVKGLLDYNHARRQLLSALVAVAEGGFWVSRPLLSRFVDSILDSARSRQLIQGTANVSKREREILKALVENLSNKEIANRFHISERTVKFHVSNLLGKFGVQRRTDLIVMYFQRAHTLSEAIH